MSEPSQHSKLQLDIGTCVRTLRSEGKELGRSMMAWCIHMCMCIVYGLVQGELKTVVVIYSLSSGFIENFRIYVFQYHFQLVS